MTNDRTDMTQWDKEKSIEKLNEMLMKHMYTCSSFRDEQIVDERGFIIQYVRDMLQQVENEWAGDK